MSVTLQNVYTNPPVKCFFCHKPVTDGPVVELLWNAAITVDDSWAAECESYLHEIFERFPGALVTKTDWAECELAHVECVAFLKEGLMDDVQNEQQTAKGEPNATRHGE